MLSTLPYLGLIAAVRRRISRSVMPAGRTEQGLATMAAALLVLLSTATTAGTITIASGDVDFSALEDMLQSSVDRVGGTLEVRGSIIARSEDGQTLSTIQVPVRFYGEGSPVSFAAENPERLVVAYYDSTAYHPDVPYSVQVLSGNGDALLDAWETALLTIDLSDLIGAPIAAGERFTLELGAPVGGQVIVERRLPAILQPLMSLY